MAHSDFSLNSRKQQRYGFLFQLAPADYEAWAKGLSAAGYATDPAYPEKLIRIIENTDSIPWTTVGWFQYLVR